MPSLPIVTGKDTPVLRAKAKAVAKVTKQILKFIDNLYATLEQPGVSGVGLAAPQVGQSLQIFIAQIGGVKKGTLKVFINPTIVHYSTETSTHEEGCLSLPDEKWRDVVRPENIILEYLDEHGKQQKKAYSGFDARVIQHEYDHLQGVLYIDY